MKSLFNPWESVSGAVCFNIYSKFVKSEPKSRDELAFPVCCSFYIAANWGDVNLSNYHSIDELQKHAPVEIINFRNLLLNNLDQIKESVNEYLIDLSGSAAFSVFILDTLLARNEKYYKNNYRQLFQHSWESIFWFMQGLQDDEFRNLISEYGEPHASLYKQLVHDINYLNPEKLNR